MGTMVNNFWCECQWIGFDPITWYFTGFCAAGQYYDMASDSCVDCPVGKYKPEGSMFLGATMCLDCPNNAPNTVSLGSISAANCTSGRLCAKYIRCSVLYNQCTLVPMSSMMKDFNNLCDFNGKEMFEVADLSIDLWSSIKRSADKGLCH